MLEEARRLAVSADDPPLRIRTSISRGNFTFALGRHSEAFQEWESADAEGEVFGEKALAALARVYAIRGRVALLAAETGVAGVGGTDAAVEELKTQLNQEMALFRSDPFSTAVGNVTLGLAEKQLGRWAEAESAVRRALAFHEKELVLEDAAYDWFVIASIRSSAEDYDKALDALWAAIRFDRRAENGYGLASSWQAMGDVLQKAGRAEESQAAWHRAADIYRAINLPELAEELEARLD
jgi:tetratricopeptide (TPR) repeat protein